ncbi:MAG: hypothetical protein N2C14_11875 [Planctomycetales bacterium]
MKPTRNRGTRLNRRRGAALILAVACLAVVGTLSLSMMRLGLRFAHNDRFAEQRLQAQWLAESGVRRAAHRLLSDPTYQGEFWSLSAEELGSPHEETATVEIEIQPAPDDDDRLRIRVTAVFPANQDRAASYEQELLFRKPRS